MSQEIERKFLVAGDFMPNVTRRTRISQGYLSTDPERTVRVRIKGDKGYLTIKGQGSESGASRYEWEKEIPLGDAEELMQLVLPGAIEKTRHLVPAVGSQGEALMFEIDTFHGDNEGLVVAEIELEHEDQGFVRPDWLGQEVTGDSRYYNSYLSGHPFKSWS